MSHIVFLFFFPIETNQYEYRILGIIGLPKKPYRYVAFKGMVAKVWINVHYKLVILRNLLKAMWHESFYFLFFSSINPQQKSSAFLIC